MMGTQSLLMVHRHVHGQKCHCGLPQEGSSNGPTAVAYLTMVADDAARD